MVPKDPSYYRLLLDSIEATDDPEDDDLRLFYRGVPHRSSPIWMKDLWTIDIGTHPTYHDEVPIWICPAGDVSWQILDGFPEVRKIDLIFTVEHGMVSFAFVSAWLAEPPNKIPSEFYSELAISVNRLYWRQPRIDPDARMVYDSISSRWRYLTAHRGSDARQVVNVMVYGLASMIAGKLGSWIPFISEHQSDPSKVKEIVRMLRERAK